MVYQLSRYKDGVILIKENERVCIPFVENNFDYQKYLAWLAEGNTPLPADE
jgi:hypothetical protein